jgi:Zn-dependent protease
MPDATAELEKAAADIPLTRSAREALERAVDSAAKRGDPEANPLDVLRAVIASRGSLADETIRSLGVDPAAVVANLPVDGAAPALPLRQLLVNANREAQVLGHYQVDSIHLLLALLYSDTPATSAALQKAGLTLFDVRRHLQMGAKPDTPVNIRPAGARAPDRKLRRKPLPSLRGVIGVSPIFLGLLAIVVVTGLLLWLDVVPQAAGILTLLFVTAGWIASVCIHEFSHALVGYLGGDRDVAASGYLTLDPLRYTHVVMSIVLPIAALLLGGFGLPGGAVYINNAALRSRIWDSFVSLAGPIGTALCALLIGGVFLLASHLDWYTPANETFFEGLAFLGYVEGFAVMFNLIPIPPLDGYGIIGPWLPYSIQSAARRVGMTGFIVIFLVLWYVPGVGSAFSHVALQVSTMLGIDPYFVYMGQQHMRFR